MHPQTAYEPEVLPMVLPTEVKVLLALVPRVVMAAMHTTMIRASMTAYSTAVGPSSRFRNRTALLGNLVTGMPPKDGALGNPCGTPTPPGRSCFGLRGAGPARGRQRRGGQLGV